MKANATTSGALFSLLVAVSVGCGEDHSAETASHELHDASDSNMDSVLDGGLDVPDASDPPDQQRNDVARAPTMAGCDPTLAWSMNPGPYAFLYGDTAINLSPDGQLGAIQSGMSREYFRTDRGMPLGVESVLQGVALDRDWAFDMRLGEASVELLDIASGELRWVLDFAGPSDSDLDWLSGIHAASSDDGQYLAMVGCWRGVGSSGFSQTLLDLWNLADGTRRRTLDLGESCSGQYWLDRPIIRFAVGGHVVVRMPGSGRVHVVELDGEVDLVEDLSAAYEPAQPLGGSPPAYVPLLSPVVAMDPSPEAGRLAVVTHDGRLRFYELPGLAHVGPVIDVGVSGINLWSYGPSIASPLAWSRDGALIGHMSSTGQVAVSRADTGETVLTLPNPESESYTAAEDSPNPPVALRFVDEDSGLLTVHESGWRRWQCGDCSARPQDELNVQLEGPLVLSAGERYWYEFAVHGSPEPAIYSLWVDGAGPVAASLSRRLLVQLWAPGVHHLVGRVVSFSGWGETAPLELVVHEAGSR